MRPPVSGLYSIDASGSPSLHGRRCRDCGYVFFPPHDFGCEVCGALPERTDSMMLAGHGVLRAFAVVHRHGGGGAGPFTVGEIALDAGPTVRAVLRSGDALAIGDRMRATLWTAPAAGSEELVELRFEPSAGAERTGNAPPAAVSAGGDDDEDGS
jgi:uncharacterized OB-fold protein